MRPLHIGNLVLDVPFFQASLSGYTDWAMRLLAKEFTCPLTLTGVMLAKSAANPKVLRKDAFRPFPDEHPVGAQILSRCPTTMAQAARDLITAGYDLIDLNFACPVPKVLRRGRGGALLKEPDRVIDIIKAVKAAVDCPLMIKLRIGINRKPQSQTNFWEIVDGAVQNQVDALVIHGRTVSERYHGSADWDILARVKQAYPHATVIGSGDIFEARESIDLMQKSGLDGIITARGVVGNPWLIRELRTLFEGKPLPAPPGLSEQKEVMLHHLDMVLTLYEERRGIGYFRKFAAGYARRHPQRKKAQLAMMATRTENELREAIDQWYG